jgi:hypothetical protein
MRGVTTSCNGVDVIAALAGTGKTFTAGTIRRRRGRRLPRRRVAPAGRAVRELAEEAAIAASTLDRRRVGAARGDRAQRKPAGRRRDAPDGCSSSPRPRTRRRRPSRAKLIVIADSARRASVQRSGSRRRKLVDFARADGGDASARR